MRRFAFLLLILSASLAEADALSLKRGVNTTLWLEWRSMGELLADPSYLDTFPDVRRDVTSAMYESLYDHGFDFVRMPIDPGPLIAYGPGERQDRLIDGMRIAVETALDAELKVVVDLQPINRGSDIGSIDGILGDDWPDYVTLVGRIAEMMKDLPADRVALELLNEPTFDCDAVYSGAPPRWPAMQAEAHAAARAAAPDLTIVLTGACWGQANALASLDPALIPDTNVLWTFHSYEPFLFSHQGATWSSAPEKYVWDLPYPPSLVTDDLAAELKAAAAERMTAAEGQADTEAIARAIDDYRNTPPEAVFHDFVRAGEWADQHGIPRDRILMGEFGALHTVDGKTLPLAWYNAFLSDKRRAAENAGMGWAVLSYVGGMGIVVPDNPERRLSPDTCAALGLPCGN